jgi:uncharacterized protein
MSRTDAPNVRLVQSTYDAFARGDIDAALAAMHADIEWHEAEHSPWHAPGGHHGPTEVLTNVFAHIPADFARFEVVPERFHDAGPTVIVEGRYRATGTESSRHLDAQVCHVWTVRDGKLARYQQYTDTWQFDQVARRTE